MAHKLMLAAQNTRALTRDPADRYAIEADSFLADIVERNVLPTDCRLLQQCQATLLQGEDDAGGELSVPGRLLVFLDWLVFVPRDDSEPDLKIHVPSLEHVRAHGHGLIITHLSRLSPEADVDSAHAGSVADQV